MVDVEEQAVINNDIIMKENIDKRFDI